MIETSLPTPEILSLWNRLFPPYPLDWRLFEQNTVAHWQQEGRQILVDRHGDQAVGLLMVTPGSSAPCIDALGVLPEYRRQGRATALLEAGLAGLETVFVGGSLSHFLPGIPAEFEKSTGFFRKRDFQTVECSVDLAQDLTPRHGPFESCGPGQVPALLAMLEREFPGRWSRDTRHRLELEGNLEDVVIVREGDEVLGFCHTWHSGNRWLGPSTYWVRHQPLAWGGIGPVGMAAAARGRGLGQRMLAESLNYLSHRRVGRVVVDWTTLVDFYGRAGFEVCRSYTRMARRKPGGPGMAAP
ncbi:MAG: GNAT family N-acetyltransferase [Vulcanimicrobiota bacterium]